VNREIFATMKKKHSNQQHEEELKFIKEQYLGSKRSKKQIVKPSKKFQVSFDWNNSEDTSRDINPLYQTPHEAQLLFGRGFRGGIDHGTQKKSMSKSKNNMTHGTKLGQMRE
jgi:ATP-dependent RNA helicase DDX23/PRP28